MADLWRAIMRTPLGSVQYLREGGGRGNLNMDMFLFAEPKLLTPPPFFTDKSYSPMDARSIYATYALE